VLVDVYLEVRVFDRCHILQGCADARRDAVESRTAALANVLPDCSWQRRSCLLHVAMAMIR
jgi:hypothetical protein